MYTEFDDTLLIKYFLKDSTEAENKLIYEWLTASPKHKREFSRLKFIWNLSTIKNLYQEIDTEQELYSLKTKIYRRKAYFEKIKYIFITAISTAAVISLLLLFPRSKTPEIIPVETATLFPTQSHTQITIPKGLEGTITLMDGTKVWINSDSRIIYPKDYNLQNRKIYLEGEAYFEVKSNPNSPFQVETSNVSVIVTGTRFNLSSYINDNTIEATLCQGIITMRPNNDQTGKNEIRLQPNNKVVYNKDNGKIKTEMVDSQLATVWKDGILSFKEIPLREIIKKLERKFNTSIQIQTPEIGNYIYTATFEKEKGLKAILDIISTSAPISYQMESDGSITIQQT